jgi:hypothetical protein
MVCQIVVAGLACGERRHVQSVERGPRPPLAPDPHILEIARIGAAGGRLAPSSARGLGQVTLVQPDAGVQLPEPPRRPPVPPTHEGHQGGHQERPDDARVDGDRERGAEPELLGRSASSSR